MMPTVDDAEQERLQRMLTKLIAGRPQPMRTAYLVNVLYSKGIASPNTRSTLVRLARQQGILKG